MLPPLLLAILVRASDSSASRSEGLAPAVIGRIQSLVIEVGKTPAGGRAVAGPVLSGANKAVPLSYILPTVEIKALRGCDERPCLECQRL